MHFISPKLSHEQALGELSKPPGPLRKRRNPRSIEIVYLPNYIFNVKIELQSEMTTQEISVDGLLGTFAFFDRNEMEFSKKPKGLVPIFEIDEDQARELGLEEYRRHLLRYALKKKKPATIKGVLSCEQMYYPYWVAYYDKGGVYDFDAIDGVSGARQGSKVRPVFIKVFSQ